jgi:DegV family protein with EDD domain
MVLFASSAIQLSGERIKELNINIIEYPLFVNGESYNGSVNMTMNEKNKLRDIVKDKKNKIGTSGLAYEALSRGYGGFSNDNLVHMEQSLRVTSATEQMLKKVLEDHKDFKVEIFDTDHLASAYSVQVLEAAKALKKGISDDDFHKLLKENRKNTKNIGVIHDLFFLNRAGKVGFAKALLATVFNLLPILSSTDIPGQLKNVGKAKTAAQANQILINLIDDDMKKKSGKRISTVISYFGDHEKEIAQFVEMYKNKGWNSEIEVCYASHSNIAHMGPDFYELGYIIYQ